MCGEQEELLVTEGCYNSAYSKEGRSERVQQLEKHQLAGCCWEDPARFSEWFPQRKRIHRLTFIARQLVEQCREHDDT